MVDHITYPPCGLYNFFSRRMIIDDSHVTRAIGESVKQQF